MGTTIQAIFQNHFQAYAKNHRQPLHYHKMAQHLINCRTAKLGGHSLYCENGHLDGVWYNSCKHRCCPQCNGTGQTRWVEKVKKKLLKANHVHIVFSIPSEYRQYWRLNTRIMIDVLFKAAKETLTDLLINDPEKKYLDAIPGFILALHTWGRNLTLNPHIHCAISAGGLNKKNQWVNHKRKYLLPAKVLMLIFRGKFNDFLRQASKDPDWQYPQNIAQQQLINLTNKMGRKKWQVYIKPEFKQTGALLNYLVNYMKGGPLKNIQIQQTTPTHMVFKYYAHKDNPDGRKTHYKTMKLTHEQFFERYLQHIPPFRKATLRQYGLYANGSRKNLNKARQKLNQSPLPDKIKDKKDIFLTWDQCIEIISKHKPNRKCKQCNGLLTIKKSLPYYILRAPPACSPCLI